MLVSLDNRSLVVGEGGAPEINSETEATSHKAYTSIISLV